MNGFNISAPTYSHTLYKILRVSVLIELIVCTITVINAVLEKSNSLNSYKLCSNSKGTKNSIFVCSFQTPVLTPA